MRDFLTYIHCDVTDYSFIREQKLWASNSNEGAQAQVDLIKTLTEV